MSSHTFSGVLLSSGRLTDDILKTVMQDEGVYPYKACQRLIDMGFIAEEDLLKILGGHFGYPYLSLKNYQFKELFIEGLSENFMRESKCVPLELSDNKLTLAVSNPFDRHVLDAIRMVTKYTLDIRLAKDAEIADAIEKLFSTGTSAMDRIIESSGRDEAGEFSMEDEGDVDHLKDLASEAPVIRLVNLIISRAVELQASDIHFEPFEKTFHVRYRIDGVLN
ncbi:MAG: type II secretion system protein GspE, partial [Pseudomonadota bacterium]